MNLVQGKKIFICLLLACFSNNVFSATTPRWTADNRHLPNSMTVTAIVVNSGEEVRSEQIEIGAFSDGECRGSAFLQYVSVLDRYIVFLMIFGEGDEEIVLKVFDHATDEEYDTNNPPLTFASDLIRGNPSEPYTIYLGEGGGFVDAILDFDTYVATKWNNNTFMLDLNRLFDDGYMITDCKWYRNNDEFLGERYTLSAGSQISDRFEAGVYWFVITTNNRGIVRSTDKIIDERYIVSSVLKAYPNPVLSGSVLTVENVAEGSAIDVYNQSGMRVLHTRATESPVTLTLNFPAGAYIIRIANGETKVIIEN